MGEIKKSMKTAEEMAEEIRSMFVIHSFNGVPHHVEIETHRIAKALTAYAEERVREAKTECESFHANNEDVALLARAEVLEEAARVAEKWMTGTPSHITDSLVCKIRALKEKQ